MRKRTNVPRKEWGRHRRLLENPDVRRWRMIKKAAANALYADTDAMKKSVRRMLRRGEIGVAKMNSCLLG